MNENDSLTSTARILAKRSSEVIERRVSQDKDEPKVTSVELPTEFPQPSQLELFALEILDFDFSLKDEVDGMSLPIFAVNQKAQRDQLYTWVRHDGQVKMRIDAVAGRPTQHDKDLVIFVVSALMHEFNTTQQIPDYLELQTRQYLLGTERKDGGTQYAQFEGTLQRIQHMTVVVETNHGDDTKSITKDFAYITGSEVIVRSSTDQVLAVRLKVSDWLKQQISNKNVLTMNRDYFKLSGSLERRLYELFRKHCGKQGKWRVSIAVLHNLVGSASSLKEFKRGLGKLIEADLIPDYRMVLDGKGLAKLMIDVYSKDPKQLLKLL